MNDIDALLNVIDDDDTEVKVAKVAAIIDNMILDAFTGPDGLFDINIREQIIVQLLFNHLEAIYEATQRIDLCEARFGFIMRQMSAVFDEIFMNVEEEEDPSAGTEE